MGRRTHSTIAYPAIIAGIQPLTLLLAAGWRTFFSVPEHFWNLGLSVAAGLLLFMALRADTVRLGVGVLLDRGYWLRVPVYSAIAGAATQIPRIALELLFGYRRGFPPEIVLERIWKGVAFGGAGIALMVATALIVLTYLAAVRITATGEKGGSSLWTFVDRTTSAGIVTGAFMLYSLSSSRFVADTASVISGLGVLHALLFALGHRCRKCGRRRAGALLLRTSCMCGHEHLALARQWANTPYDRHLAPLPVPGPEHAVASGARAMI